MNGLGVVCVFSECRGSQAPPYGSTFRSRVERARNPSLQPSEAVERVCYGAKRPRARSARSKKKLHSERS